MIAALAALNFLKSHWRAIGIGAIALLLLSAFSYAYVKGRNDGEASALDAARRQLVDQLNERGKIDGITEQMDNSELCRALGRVWHDGQCT